MLKSTNKKEPNGSLDRNKIVALEGCGQVQIYCKILT